MLPGQDNIEIWRRTSRHIRPCWPAVELSIDIPCGECGPSGPALVLLRPLPHALVAFCSLLLVAHPSCASAWCRPAHPLFCRVSCASAGGWPSECLSLSFPCLHCRLAATWHRTQFSRVASSFCCSCPPLVAMPCGSSLQSSHHLQPGRMQCSAPLELRSGQLPHAEHLSCAVLGLPFSAVLACLLSGAALSVSFASAPP